MVYVAKLAHRKLLIVRRQISESRKSNNPE